MPQGAALLVERATGGKVLRKRRRTFERSGDRRFVDEEHVVHEFAHDLVEIDRGDTIYEYMKPSFATPIFAAIDDNMEALGYERVGIDDDPELILTPAGLSSTTFFYSYWYDWWYYGYGWYYPPYYTVSSYTTGTFIITISDPELANDSPINRSPAVWISVANGLASGYYDITRVTESIDQSFEQSPYLKTN